MWVICKKEWNQFFNNITGYLAIAVFLLVLGLVLFVFPDTSILDFGYASLNYYFDVVPWVLMFLIPVITMKSFSEEFKSGTYEVLKTLPIKSTQLISGKILGCFFIVLIALLPTLIYYLSIQALSESVGVDTGAFIGSFLGLLFLATTFVSISVFASSLTNNIVVSFLTAVLLLLILYSGFEVVGNFIFNNSSNAYYVEMMGMKSHFKSISRGVIDSRDIVYFLSVLVFFLFLTNQKIKSHI